MPEKGRSLFGFNVCPVRRGAGSDAWVLDEEQCDRLRLVATG